MKNLTVFIVRWLAIGVLLAPFIASQADDYSLTGEVFDIRPRHINVDDLLLPISPTAKVTVPGKDRGMLSDIKRGDHVGLQLTRFDGQFYVSKIVYLSDGEADDIEAEAGHPRHGGSPGAFDCVVGLKLGKNSKKIDAPYPALRLWSIGYMGGGWGGQDDLRGSGLHRRLNAHKKAQAISPGNVTTKGDDDSPHHSEPSPLLYRRLVAGVNLDAHAPRPPQRAINRITQQQPPGSGLRATIPHRSLQV